MVELREGAQTQQVKPKLQPVRRRAHVNVVREDFCNYLPVAQAKFRTFAQPDWYVIEVDPATMC